MMKSRSPTHKFVTLSSAEADMVADVKDSTEAVCIIHMAVEWGLRVSGAVRTDSTAARAIWPEKRKWPLRHAKVGHLWIQEMENSQELKYRKVHGETNPADLMTKHLTAERGHVLCKALHQMRRPGRAAVGLAMCPARQTPADTASMLSRVPRGGVLVRAAVGGDRWHALVQAYRQTYVNSSASNKAGLSFFRCL